MNDKMKKYLEYLYKSPTPDNDVWKPWTGRLTIEQENFAEQQKKLAELQAMLISKAAYPTPQECISKVKSSLDNVEKFMLLAHEEKCKEIAFSIWADLRCKDA